MDSQENFIEATEEQLYAKDVGRARNERLQEKDYKNIKLIHDMLEKSLRAKSMTYTKDAVGEAIVIDWVKARLREKYTDIESRVELDGETREKLYRIDFNSKWSNRQEYIYVIFDKKGEFDPDIIPPGVYVIGQK